MPSRKGTVTGANLDNPNRGKKGALTGSKRVTGEGEGTPLPDVPSPYGFDSSPEVAATDEAARANLKEKLQQAGQVIAPVVGAVGAAVKGVASQVTATVNGSIDYNPSSLTNGTVDAAGILSKADASVDESVPQLDSGEAIKRNIIIARQRNYVGVAINNTKLKQDLATLDLEQQRLIGLLIDGKTARINNEKKAVTYHRSVVGRDIELSKLEQDNELLTQQQIRTEGTQNQTELIKEQEQLKVDKLREEVEKQKYEIENIAYEKEKIKQEAVAKFAAGF
ncbi:hypothetical protein F7734_43180 [Scytonema sp. UIC 10036]|uniref:hypothetical protein n=1 Tax=Scytonema sp. UIC 10036 TaxID=2304196 RepID=UPI0012DA1B4D|nr:hypothetical protein [Scytonema sp. UIC 10036]MUG98737.1 hypothetical protein [Scytonema sp. UIC 10036]